MQCGAPKPFCHSEIWQNPARICHISPGEPPWTPAGGGAEAGQTGGPRRLSALRTRPLWRCRAGGVLRVCDRAAPHR